MKLAQQAAESNDYTEHGQDEELANLPDQLETPTIRHEVEKILLESASEFIEAQALPEAEQSPYYEAIIAKLQTAEANAAPLQDENIIARAQGHLGHVLFKGKYETLGKGPEEMKEDELKAAQLAVLEQAKPAYSKLKNTFKAGVNQKGLNLWYNMRIKEYVTVEVLLANLTVANQSPE